MYRNPSQIEEILHHTPPLSPPCPVLQEWSRARRRLEFGTGDDNASSPRIREERGILRETEGAEANEASASAGSATAAESRLGTVGLWLRESRNEELNQQYVTCTPYLKEFRALKESERHSVHTAEDRVAIQEAIEDEWFADIQMKEGERFGRRERRNSAQVSNPLS
jgi:hypothetical protein